MEEDLNNKIKEIGGMLGISEMPDNIGDIVSSLLSNSSDASSGSSATDACNSDTKQEETAIPEDIRNIGNTNSSSAAHSADLFGDIDMAKVLKLLNKYQEAQKNKGKDKKIQLLYAVEPFLNEKRKDKVSNCVKFLTFAEIAKNLKDI